MKNIKRIITALLSCSLILSSCGTAVQTDIESTEVSSTHEEFVEPISTEESANVEITGNEQIPDPKEEISFDTEPSADSETEVPEFYGLSDSNLLQYVEDNIFADLESGFGSDDYIVEDVQAIYVSQEYLV